MGTTESTAEVTLATDDSFGRARVAGSAALHEGHARPPGRAGGKRVLIISYPFPPVGGAGVQRATKFVKYLPHHGWQPSVLTVANPSVPALDHSLVKDIPADVVVRRARTWEPGYAAKAAVTSARGPASDASAAGASESRSTRSRNGLKAAVKGAIHRLAKLALQPDPQILWMPDALRQGRRLLDEVPHAAIVASGPPFSTFLIGASLSRHSGVPLVLDYRDEWDISNTYLENKRLDDFSLFLQSRMQENVVRAAKALVATTGHSAEALRRIRDRVGGGAQVTWIYNGFDPDDFRGVGSASESPDKTYRLAYVGTLWNLTNVDPLVKGAEELARRSPDLAKRLELVFAGRRTSQQSDLLSRLKSLPCRLVEFPYLDHSGAVELIESAHGLCVLLSDVPAAERVVPAKIFEYMASKRAVVGIGPPGEMWDLLRKYPGTRLNRPGDVGGIADTLAAEIRRVGSARPLDLGDWDPSAYSRHAEAGQLARLLESLA